MKKIEITVDEETGMYCINQKINGNYQQGIRTYDIDEGLRYLGDRMEKLTYDDRQTTTTIN